MQRKSNDSSAETIGLLARMIRELRLIWRLLSDERVPVWIRSIPVLALAYVIFPLDFLPDYVLGLGQLDDVTVLFLGLRLFLSLCPPALVQEHLRQMDAVEAEYSVAHDSEEDQRHQLHG